MKLFLVMILESKYKVFLHTRRGQTRPLPSAVVLLNFWVKFLVDFEKIIQLKIYEPKIRQNFDRTLSIIEIEQKLMNQKFDRTLALRTKNSTELCR